MRSNFLKHLADTKTMQKDSGRIKAINPRFMKTIFSVRFPNWLIFLKSGLNTSNESLENYGIEFTESR